MSNARPAPASPTARTTITIDPRDLADLEREARVRGVSVSALVRESLAATLKESRARQGAESSARELLLRAGHKSAAARIGKAG